MTKDLIELRRYVFASDEKLKTFDQFLAQAMVPALNRAGVQPAGVFRVLKEDNPQVDLAWENPMLYVLLPHKSAQSLLTLEARLAEDAGFQESGKAVLKAPKADPAYLRYESSVLAATAEAPQVEVPAASAARLMQLRIYESHNEEHGAKKVHMFNEGGELDIFRRYGMHWVFFGQAVAGAKLPNLTYMLAFENQEAMDKAWGAFRSHPDWKTLSSDEAYKDTVSTITNLMLKPTEASQV